MTLSEYNNKLEQTSRDIQNRIGETIVELGTEALTLIKKRVQETGKNAEGQAFVSPSDGNTYSHNPMLVGCKSMNADVCKSFFGKEKNKQLSWVTLDRTNNQGKKIRLAVLEGGYDKFRKLHGRQTNFVDFTFSGDMWNDIKIISKKTEHNTGTIVIGAEKEEEKKKLEGNTKREGTILDLSDSEIETLKHDFKLKTLYIIRNNGI